MVSLLELSLSGIATEKGVAVLVDAIAEVLTRHADTGSFPALQLPLIHKVPLLHDHLGNSTAVLAKGS